MIDLSFRQVSYNKGMLEVSHDGVPLLPLSGALLTGAVGHFKAVASYHQRSARSR
jgi:hypothetical protein